MPPRSTPAVLPRTADSDPAAKVRAMRSVGGTRPGAVRPGAWDRLASAAEAEKVTKEDE
jgi:hypothetical protein